LESAESDNSIDTHLIVLANDRAECLLLIANEAKVNPKNKSDYTPLYYAGKSQEITALLVNKEADVKTKNNQGITLIHNPHESSGKSDCNISCSWNRYQYSRQRRQNHLHYLAINDSQSVAELLINQGANVNSQDNNI